MANDVWVYIEHKDGETTPMSFELLGIGKTLANELGSSLCAFVFGENVENAAKEVFQCGASKVYAVEGAIFKGFNAEAYSKAAGFLLDKYKPEVALFRATSQGMDVAAA
ncbi:MAG: electron transfer flavoprotein subunit alpha, partial [Deltaproteobacteria bacterium]